MAVWFVHIISTLWQSILPMGRYPQGEGEIADTSRVNMVLGAGNGLQWTSQLAFSSLAAARVLTRGNNTPMSVATN